MKFTTRTLINAAIFAALGSTALTAFAVDGYVTDSQGKIVRDNFGQCWHTNEWTKEKAIAECEPDLVAKKVVEAPKMVEAAKPVDAPKPMPMPHPQVTKKVETFSLNASGLFDLGKFVLKPEGKQSLESVAKELTSSKYDESKTKIVVKGHTDRLGKTASNQKLSEERATAAKEFLVSNGVPASIITSEGKGSTEPVTRPEDCKKFAKKKAKLVQCYAPDRRVDIEIYATREAQ